MKKIICALLMLSVLLAFGAGAEGAVDMIKQKGELVLGTEATFPPYEFLDENAVIVGSDIWLGQQIADALGVKLTVKDMEFNGIIPAVQAGQVDIGLAGFTKTEERAKVIDFSILYESGKQLLIVKKGNGEKFSSAGALAGMKVGAQLGSIQSELIGKALPDSELFELDTNPNLALETLNGGIAGFVVDDAVGIAMAESNPGLEAAGLVFAQEEAESGKAAVLPKGSEELAAVVNAVIEKALRDGSYAAAYEAAVLQAAGK